MDNAAIGTILGCFQDSTAATKIQQDCAWWFNDHKKGMEELPVSLANLSNLIGNWVENGEFPADMDVLEEIVKGIAFNNAKAYFKLELE